SPTSFHVLGPLGLFGKFPQARQECVAALVTGSRPGKLQVPRQQRVCRAHVLGRPCCKVALDNSAGLLLNRHSAPPSTPRLSQSIVAPRGSHLRKPDGPCGPPCPVHKQTSHPHFGQIGFTPKRACARSSRHVRCARQATSRPSPCGGSSCSLVRGVASRCPSASESVLVVVEKRHETSASSLSASRRRRCRIAGAAAARMGARLSNAAGTHRRPLSRRNCARHCRA